jgi:hypothetical protein
MNCRPAANLSQKSKELGLAIDDQVVVCFPGEITMNFCLYNKMDRDI